MTNPTFEHLNKTSIICDQFTHQINSFISVIVVISTSLLQLRISQHLQKRLPHVSAAGLVPREGLPLTIKGFAERLISREYLWNGNAFFSHTPIERFPCHRLSQREMCATVYSSYFTTLWKRRLKTNTATDKNYTFFTDFYERTWSNSIRLSLL